MQADISAEEKNLRITTYVLYGLLTVVLFVNGPPIFMDAMGLIIVAVFSGIRRKQALGTLYDSHLFWIIVTTILAMVVSVTSGEIITQMKSEEYRSTVSVIIIFWLLCRIAKGIVMLRKNRSIKSSFLILI